MKNLPDKIYLSFGEMSEDRFEKEDYEEFCEYHNNLVAFYKKKFWETDVEYTRTDAFIKKACEWIETNMDDYIHVEYDTVTGKPTNEAHIAHKRVIEDFKKYMKGE